MRKQFTLLIFLSFNYMLLAQPFVELCENSTINGTVVAFEALQNEIYATGFFTTICGSSSGHLAKWEDEIWKPANISLPGDGHALTQINDLLYISSYHAGGDSNWVFTYDGTALNKLGTGFHLTTATGFSQLPHIYDIISYQDEIYVCGEFDRVGQQQISGIVKWNGSAWEGIGNISGNIPNSPTLTYPHEMLVWQDELWIVGNFGAVDGIEVNGVAKWNGTNWAAVGSGFNSTVYGIGEYDGEVYAGGDFTKSGDQNVNRIAKWDGTNWISLGFGFINATPQDYIFAHTIKSIDDELFVAGGLEKIELDDGSQIDCGGIISYDGAVINTFDGGIPGNDIEAIIKDAEGNLLIGGGVFGSGYVGILKNISSTSQTFEEKEFRLVPNPAAEEITVVSDLEYEKIKIFDAAGQLVRVIDRDDNTINLNSLSKGIYFMEIQSYEAKHLEKFIKL